VHPKQVQAPRKRATNERELSRLGRSLPLAETGPVHSAPRPHASRYAAARVPQVANFESAAPVDEQVARLDVPVQHAGAVKVEEPPQELEHQELDAVRPNRLPRLDDAGEVAGHPIKDQERVVKRAHVGRQQHVTQLHKVVVAPQQAVELDLPQNARRHHVRVKDRSDALYRHVVATLAVNGGVDNAIGTLCARARETESGAQTSGMATNGEGRMGKRKETGRAKRRPCVSRVTEIGADTVRTEVHLHLATQTQRHLMRRRSDSDRTLPPSTRPCAHAHPRRQWRRKRARRTAKGLHVLVPAGKQVHRGRRHGGKQVGGNGERGDDAHRRCGRVRGSQRRRR